MRDKADAFGAQYVDLKQVAFVPEILRHVPARLAHKYQVLPLRLIAHTNCLKLALSDPSALDSIDHLHQELPYHLEICVADAHQLRTFINKLYPSPT